MVYPDTKILLIENNLDDIRIIEEYLKEAFNFNFDLKSAHNLSDGLKYIEEGVFDVILLDLSLPDSTGLETILRTKEKVKNIPIIIFNGTDDTTLSRKAVQIGAQDYLVKGQIDSNPLVRSIFHAIDRHKMFLSIESLAKEVTELMQSEQEVKKLEQTLKEINALIENAPLAIFLTHQNGEILRVNEEAQKLFGYSLSKLLTFKIFDLFDLESLDVVNKHYHNDIYNLSMSNKMEAMVITRDKKKIHIEVTSTILRIADNVIIQSFFSDITERKDFEKSRQLLMDQLLASLEFKTKFLATMSHELRTPLNAVLGFSQLLLEESYGSLNEEQKDFLNDINSAGNHLFNLINSILDLSKIEAGKLTLNFEKFNLKEIVDEINTVISPLYSKKGLEFIIENIDNDQYLIADPLRFKQILFNLFSNANKFTEKGIIKFRGIERIDHWEFQVIDTGIGIAKKDYDVVFREFGRIENDTTKDVSGAGLGLAVTQRLVQLHGGDIWFKSELGKGTTFYFTISKKE